MKLSFILLFVAILSGCSSPDPKLLETINVGVVVDSNVIPTSFNESTKTSIKTDKAMFVIHATPTVFIGDEATIRKYDNGLNYLCLSSWSRMCYNIYLN